MPDKILLKRSLTSGSIPTISSMSVGELAINVPDGKLFLRQSGSGTDAIRSLLTVDAQASGNIFLTGSITTTGNILATSITGSLLGTSSWAQNSISSSAATSITFTTFSNASYYFPQDVRVDGTLTVEKLQTEYITSSVIYESGSTKFGDSLDDTHQFTGSVSVLGSITGSLLGTSSWSSNTISASYAQTSSLTFQVSVYTGSVSEGSTSYTGLFTGSFVGNGSLLTNVGNCTISASAPTVNVEAGDLWYDDTTGKTYIYYTSASVSSWVLQADPTYDPGTIIQAATASLALTIPSSQPATAQTGSIYFSGGFLYVYNGTKYLSASLN